MLLVLVLIYTPISMSHHRGDQPKPDDAFKNKRIHMSCKPVGSVHNTPQPRTPNFKPDGFWYGFGFSWVSWIDGEMPDWRCDHFYEVVIAPGAKVLKISNVGAFDDFDRKYRPRGSRYIDWTAVANDYQGIEIKPYLWARRMDSDWYYSWDVASGCIWGANAVAELRPLPSLLFDKDRVWVSQDEDDE